MKMRNTFVACLGINTGLIKSSMNLSFLVVVTIFSVVNSECPVCDINDYHPVCASGRAFRSICALVRLSCLGQVELINNAFGICRRIDERPSVVRGVVRFFHHNL